MPAWVPKTLNIGTSVVSVKIETQVALQTGTFPSVCVSGMQECRGLLAQAQILIGL